MLLTVQTCYACLVGLVSREGPVTWSRLADALSASAGLRGFGHHLGLVNFGSPVGFEAQLVGCGV